MTKINPTTDLALFWRRVTILGFVISMGKLTFELHTKRGDKFLCLTLFWTSKNCSSLQPDVQLRCGLNQSVACELHWSSKIEYCWYLTLIFLLIISHMSTWICWEVLFKSQQTFLKHKASVGYLYITIKLQPCSELYRCIFSRMLTILLGPLFQCYSHVRVMNRWDFAFINHIYIICQVTRHYKNVDV